MKKIRLDKQTTQADFFIYLMTLKSLYFHLQKLSYIHLHLSYSCELRHKRIPCFLLLVCNNNNL